MDQKTKNCFKGSLPAAPPVRYVLNIMQFGMTDECELYLNTLLDGLDYPFGKLFMT